MSSSMSSSKPQIIIIIILNKVFSRTFFAMQANSWDYPTFQCQGRGVYDMNAKCECACRYYHFFSWTMVKTALQ